MTTEEIKNKLKISENTCIHCPTIKLAIQMSNIFHQLGLRWKSGTHYTLNSNWDSFKENTVYYPFKGECSSLEFAHCTNYKIINAKEFIALHTEFDLENYIPKGDLIGFPKEIISRMLYCQEEQGNPRDVSVFEKGRAAGQYNKGFTWNETKEGSLFWSKVINTKDFDIFFEKYPKKDNQDNSQEFRVDDLENYIPKGRLEGFPKEIIARMLECQEKQGNPRNISVFERNKYNIVELGGFDWDKTIEKDIFWEEVIGNKNFNLFFEKYPKQDSQDFRVGDEVIDIITRQRGKILEINTNDGSNYPIYVSVNKYPRLLHYRDDYDYSIIDFNNLPKRQEPKRWRAEKGDIYYSFTSNFGVEESIEDNYYLDNKAYDSGNYFKTKEEAQEVADKLNKYFQELIQTKNNG